MLSVICAKLANKSDNGGSISVFVQCKKEESARRLCWINEDNVSNTDIKSQEVVSR